MSSLIILVCGGRHYNDRNRVFEVLDYYNSEVSITHIIHGDAAGADRFADQWAIERGVSVIPYPAEWTNLTYPDAIVRRRQDGTLYDARAGNRRNAKMLREGRPDAVIAFPGGTGTADMVRQAKRLGVQVIEVP